MFKDLYFCRIIHINVFIQKTVHNQIRLTIIWIQPNSGPRLTQKYALINHREMVR